MTVESKIVASYSSYGWLSIVYHAATMLCCVYLLVRLDNVQSQLLKVEELTHLKGCGERLVNTSNGEKSTELFTTNNVSMTINHENL